MEASIEDKITKTFDTVNPEVTRVAIYREPLSNVLYADNLAGWPTLTSVHFSTYKVDSNDKEVEGSQIDWKGIVDEENNVIRSLTWQAGAEDGGNEAGDVIEMNPTASWANDMAEGFLAEHTTKGKHVVTPEFARAIADATVPVGVRREYFGTKATFNADDARFGWLFMEKELAYSKVEYSKLYNHLKTVDADSVKEDTGETFKFANKFFGTVSVAVDASQPEFDTLGKSGGVKSHNIKAVDMGFTNPGGSYSVTTNLQYIGQVVIANSGFPSGMTISNIEPYNSTNYLIKY